MTWAPFGRYLLLLLLTAVFHPSLPAYAQETEPNNTCAGAQDLGSPALPLAVTGSLDTPPGTPDVDFFRITAPAGVVRIDLEGAANGSGTLPDPFVGTFNSMCEFIAFNDDSGSGLNSRLVATVPADGVLVIAATSCCDDDLTGDGNTSGSYVLGVASAPVAGSISGRLVDAASGDPLPGDAPPFGFAFLERCEDGSCLETQFINQQLTDSNGRFLFDSDFSGAPLLTGTYRITAFADQYQLAFVPPFEVGEGADVDLGDIALSRIALAASNQRTSR